MNSQSKKRREFESLPDFFRRAEVGDWYSNHLCVPGGWVIFQIAQNKIGDATCTSCFVPRPTGGVNARRNMFPVYTNGKVVALFEDEADADEFYSSDYQRVGGLVAVDLPAGDDEPA